MTKLKALQVLLADDDEDDREFFSRAMNEVDPSVGITLVEDGEALMKELNKNNPAPDLIFLDMNMPRKNGMECLIEIGNDEELRKIPVIIYSTSISMVESEEEWSKGVRCFIRKPDSYRRLKEIVSEILNIDFFQLAMGERKKIVFNL
jgi:CheY-like chemotaxis protein